MSRYYIIFLLLFCGLQSFGQTNVVKDVEHQLGVAKPDYAAVLKAITPALTNEETKNNAQAWFLAGKAAVGVWDKMFLDLQVGADVSADRKKQSAHALIDAYGYFLHAIPLDSLPDAKGRVKPKYLKEMRKILSKTYRSYRNAGIFLYDLHDLDGAFDAWEIYVTMPERFNASHKTIKADRLSELGQIYYYQGFCAILTGRNGVASEKFQKAYSAGYSSKDLFLYGLESARRAGNDSLKLEFARLGNQLYGNEEVSFSLLLINDRLAAEDYDSCRVLVGEALKVKSDDKVKSQLYDVLGVTYEHCDNIGEALANFQKAVVYDPDNAKGYFDLARVIHNEALRYAGSGVPDAEQNAAPGFKKAAEYFEKAYELDSSMSQIPETLYAIYYRLGIGYEEKASYWQKKL